MHIIFGQQQADQLSEKYTVLELDTFQLGTDGPIVTAFCAVETMPFEELPFLVENQAQHQELIKNYGQQAWQDCLLAIDHLKGKWRGELDSFYQDLETRIQGYILSLPPTDWSPIIQK